MAKKIIFLCPLFPSSDNKTRPRTDTWPTQHHRQSNFIPGQSNTIEPTKVSQIGLPHKLSFFSTQCMDNGMTRKPNSYRAAPAYDNIAIFTSFASNIEQYWLSCSQQAILLFALLKGVKPETVRLWPDSNLGATG